jgi:gas vesicle protein
MMKDAVNFLAGMILGAAIGAVTALLFAPQSGAELRANIQEQALAERQRLQALYEQQMAELQPQLDKLQKDVQSVLENTRKMAEAESDAGEEAA